MATRDPDYPYEIEFYAATSKRVVYEDHRALL